ncbi:tripartite tricarboxylate transporter TctB family protein [Chelativorans sp.]|uniref:tripartite tricarboxylate transporter TctB family protein n=1 Tax=Chelativorans sp. TaxID=2203393 RepID=UPI0028118895|nr:tripartite tricarboxylate transporter TctB family protein [Chelativorans sp.]
MKINKTECAVAALIALFGAVMSYWGSLYGIGSLGEMGTGYFPVLLGLVTVFFGAATLLDVARSESPPPEVPWRAAVCVFSAILVWALLVERVGLFPSSVLLVIIASLGRRKSNLRSVIITAFVASAASVLIFLEGFSIPLRAIAW